MFDSPFMHYGGYGDEALAQTSQMLDSRMDAYQHDSLLPMVSAAASQSI
jgi:hypothetical protein